MYEVWHQFRTVDTGWHLVGRYRLWVMAWFQVFAGCSCNGPLTIVKVKK